MRNHWLYEVTLPNGEVELVVSFNYTVGSNALYFYGKWGSADSWVQYNNNHWVKIECLGLCDLEGNLL